MRVLYVANFSSQSGYAIQSRLFVPRLRALGHEVVVFELSNGAGLPRMTTDGIQILPTHLDPLGSDMILDHYRAMRADAALTLCDAWGFRPDVMGQLNWFPLTPIDHQPAPPGVVNALRAAVTPIAISQYGVQMLRNAGFDPLYLPHGIDPQVWQPGDKAEARRALGIDDGMFYVAFVGVNDSSPSRKGIPELLMAWSIFAPKHPNARLYLHTSEVGNLPVNSASGGVNIPLLIKTIGINPSSIIMVDQYRYKTGIPASELATIARASDVLIQPSRGEGFGLPALEFQRVGCPVIVSNFAASTELCFSGWLLEGEPEASWQGAFVQKPGVAAIVEALEAAYAERDNPARRQRAIDGAREYDIDTVISRHAVPVLRTMGETLLERWKAA